jgi:arylsulfatase A-like enzyme
MTTARPNILWIMTDQQCADGMSCAGNPDLSTPAMDSLAASGVRFENAYCANPICVPSRASMMTGRMPHEIGVNFNLDHFDILDVSVGRWLADAGYDTGYIGKWHIPMDSGNHAWHGFNLMNEGPSSTLNDEQTTKACIDFLHTERDAPFFLVASYNNPHDICEWARGAAGYTGRSTTMWNGPIPDAPPPDQCPALPGNFRIPDDEPEIIREHQSWMPGVYPTVEWNEDQWRQYRWALNRLTERVDREIGILLDALREQGLEENTLIVFVSDHGDGNSAHRWNQKSLLYDEPTRVPLIVSQKGVTTPGVVDRSHMVSTGLDLFSTFCDAAGIVPPDGLAGRSLLGPATGKAGSDCRDAVVCETVLHRRYGIGGVEGRMLRSDRYKYIAYARGRIREQLFDMHEDPGERHSLVESADHRDILNDHRRRLAAWCRETNDAFVVPGITDDGWSLTQG